MSEYIITERSNMVAVADTVRNKTGETSELTLTGIMNSVEEYEGTGGSGVSVQANYAQNDSAQPDYILNRPFYAEESLNELLPETPIPFEYMDVTGAFGFSTPPTEEQLQAWNDNWDKCIVTYDGTTYECEPKYIDGVKLIGNAEAFAGTGNSGHPFIFTVTDALTGTMLVMMQSTVDTEATTHAVAISFPSEDIHMLDSKFVDMSWDKITDRPFYVTEVLKEFLPETSLSFEEVDGLYAHIATPTEELIQAWNGNWDKCTIVYDGTTYECEPKDVGGIKAVGNAELMEGTGDSGHPFIFMVTDALTGVMQMLVISTTDTAPATHTVSMSLPAEGVCPLDPKFIADIDWETQIINKPFGDGEIISQEWLSSVDLQFSQMDEGAIMTATNIELTSEQLELWAQNWKAARIIWDGTEYICNPQVTDISGGSGVIVKSAGNIGKIMGGVNTGEPFVILADDGSTFGTPMAAIYSLNDDTSGAVYGETVFPHNVSIDLEVAGLKKIDPKYLPDGIGGLPEVTTEDNDKVLKVVDGAWTITKENELPVHTTDDNNKVLTVIDGAVSWQSSEVELPTVTTDDNGKVLSVVDGIWTSHIPEAELPVVTADDNDKVLKVVDGAWTVSSETEEPKELPVYSDEENNKVLTVVDGNITWSNIPSEIPDITDTDNGKILAVENNEIVYKTAPIEVPSSTSIDNGKFLRVVNGVAAWSVVQDASEVLF